MAAPATHVVTGIPLPPGGGPTPTRKEVTAWIAQAKSDPLYARQVALYFKAMIMFQKMDPSDELSFYRIAGIHGDPDVSWDGVRNPPNPTDPNQDPSTGWWCVHNRANFVTWHRPYLALFEQRLYETMLQVIAQSGLSAADQVPWKTAAQQWRLPYWDWAVKQDYLSPRNYGVPEVFTQQRVTISDFNGSQVQVDNPLWRFVNPRKVAMGASSMAQFGIRGQPWRSLVGTSRCGIFSQTPDPSWVDGANNWQAANVSLETADWSPSPDAGPLGEAVYKLLTPDYSSSWESFETTLYTNSDPANFMSVEYIHNYIHGWTGGTSFETGIGHMTDPAVSAFDPIFWFHHCNIDRLGTIFQTLHPNMWYKVPSKGTGPLTPFHQDSRRDFWTSNACRNWKVFNYDYDDLNQSPQPPFGVSFIAAPAAAPEVTLAAARAVPAPPAASAPPAGGHVAEASIAEASTANEVDIPALKHSINARYGRIRHALRASPHVNGRENDYIINVIYDRYALNGRPYIIHFFIGDVPQGPITNTLLRSSKSYLGSVYTFSSSLEPEGNTVACRNCRKQQESGLLSTGQVPISTALLTHAKDDNIPGLQSLEPTAVAVYLEQKLKWVAAQVNPEDDGAEPVLDIPTQLPSTKVYALGGIADHPDDPYELSTFSDYQFIWPATQGKPGGAGPNDVPPPPPEE